MGDKDMQNPALEGAKAFVKQVVHPLDVYPAIAKKASELADTANKVVLGLAVATPAAAARISDTLKGADPSALLGAAPAVAARIQGVLKGETQPSELLAGAAPAVAARISDTLKGADPSALLGAAPAVATKVVELAGMPTATTTPAKVGDNATKPGVETGRASQDTAAAVVGTGEGVKPKVRADDGIIHDRESRGVQVPLTKVDSTVVAPKATGK